MAAHNTLEFHKVATQEAAAKLLADRLKQVLAAKKRVLWLVSGGSNIPISVGAMKQVPEALQPYLAVMLVDERFGQFGHKNSNLRQLYDAGFTPGKATVVPVLLPEDVSLETTADRYQAAVQTAFANADVIIAQLGIGENGSIAGIMPGSPAIKTRKLVTSYTTETFGRLTLTPAALKQSSAAYIFAFNPTKQTIIKDLQTRKLPIVKQPAQLLKQIPQAYVYSDQVN